MVQGHFKCWGEFSSGFQMDRLEVPARHLGRAAEKPRHALGLGQLPFRKP